MRAIETVLADWQERASSCRRVKDERVADIIDEICQEFADATEDSSVVRRNWSGLNR